MKKLFLFAISCMIAGTSLFGQENFITKTGYIKFYSHTKIEDITAENHKVGSILNAKSGEMVFTLLMTDFEFEKKLMEEHFNENYVESEKFPKATFKGSVSNNETVDYSKPGVYNVTVEGNMTIHGVTNEVSAEGTIEVLKDGVKANSLFKLNPEDYGIEIPKVVREKIANDLEITVDMKYSKM